MWFFDRLKVRPKLALLAGVPVLGALLLSLLIARDAQERAATAKAIGSIEDLVQLTERVARAVHELQTERSQTSFLAGLGTPSDRDLEEQEQRTDRVLASLESFLSARDVSKLPPALGENLRAARKQLVELPALRTRVRSDKFDLYEYLEFHNQATNSLIAATSVLSQQTKDGEVMLSISRLVSTMHVSERISREHALLSYVFGKKEFPPGTFRLLVTLLTEEEVYASSFRASASAEDGRRLEAVLAGPRVAKVAAMRKTALEATDGDLAGDPREWFALQATTMQELRRLEDGMSASVRGAVSQKVRESRRAIRLGTGLAGGVMLCSTLLAWAIARSMTRSVRVLYHAADEVQRNGDFSVRAQKTSKDELGSLTDAFNAMLSGIQERDRELSQHRDNLEALVKTRTLELTRRNDQMRLVLDTVEEGLAMVDRDGNLREECSRAFVEVFGKPRSGAPFHTTLAANDRRKASALAMGYEQFIEDLLPAEAAIDQLPKTLYVGERQYALTAKPVLADGRPDGALLVVRDVTAEVAAQRADALQREQIKSFQRILQDKHGFFEFFREAQALVERIRDAKQANDPDRMRALHTLKGNAALFDVCSVSEAAHELENAVLEANEASADGALSRLLGSWDEYAEKIAPLSGDQQSQELEVPRADFEQVLTAVRQRAPYASVEKLLLRFQLEPVRQSLARVEEQLRGLARRLGKPEPDVVITTDGVCLPTAPLREFWGSFAHIVRNTVDHGILSAEERELGGKPLRTRIELNAHSNGDTLVIEIKDDGPGIDWSRLATRTKARGLPAATRADLVKALTTDGVSTAAKVTEISGRGVGLPAVLDACTRLNGKLLIDSEPGQGTRFRFVFPAMDGQMASAHEQASAHGTG
jgi:two-component system, chemotaxis family, sensor kinase CheA